MNRAFTLLFLLAPSFAMSAEIDLPSRIDRVTVYPDAALVTRVGAVSLPEGASTLVLRGLPASLDPGSVRVEGGGSAALAIGGVDLRTVPGEARPAINLDLEGRIRALRDEHEAVTGRVGALETKRAAIERYAKAGPERLGEADRALDIGQWSAAWDLVGAGLAAVNEELRPLRRRLRELDAEVAALEAARPAPARGGQPRRDLAVAVEASAALSGEIRVSYRVSGAAWVPVYDARLDTTPPEGGMLELVRRAQVTQRTGEEWTDVALTVSTVRVTRGTVAPELSPQIVAFNEPQAYRGGMARERAAPPPASAAPAPAPDAEAGAARPIPAREVEAGVEAGAFQASFSVPGRVSVARDGSTRGVVLGRQRPRPQLLVRTAPALDTTAYLEAAFTNVEEAPLLPGEVALHRDGAYVGRARLALAAQGETVTLGFGADDRVRVARVPLRRRETEPGWIGSTRSDLREWKTTVRNLHATPMRIVVVDRLPVSENEAIKVEPGRETTPPTERQVEDRRGVMAWAYDYAPGETREIRLAYRLRWPADRDITFMERPLPR